MHLLLDRGIATFLFALGTAMILGAWLDLFPVPSPVLFVAFPAMLFGGTGLLLQFVLGPRS